MLRSRFKLPAEGSPYSGTTRVLAVDVTPARASDVAETLRELIEQLPEHPCVLPLIDAGVTAAGRPFIVTPPVPGQPLASALQEYGPAALADALPRLQQIADGLDRAAQEGLHHGALTPSDILVSADDTRVVGVGVADSLRRLGLPLPLSEVYAAPEAMERGAVTARSDQWSLAVIAHEWLFGEPATGDELQVPPGVDRERFIRVFRRALATEPAQRFATCAAFTAAIAAAASTTATPPVPLDDRGDELPLNVEGNAPRDLADQGTTASAVLTRVEARRAGTPALASALMVGATLGAVGMWWMAWRTTPASSDVARVEEVVDTTTDAGPPTAPQQVTEAEIQPPAADRVTTASLTTPVSDAPRVSRADAGLLVHTTPAGASVTIDGVARGMTPLAVRGLELGTRTVAVSRPGYRTVQRQVTLTSDRPSRTLEVEMATLVPARPAREVSATGNVVFDSRPAGASVFVDDRAVGVTPMTLGLPPGTHTVRLERAGYRTITTRVLVTAGERTRVAARLEGGLDPQ